MNTRLGRLLVIFLFLFAMPMLFTACAGKKGGGGGKKGGGGGGDHGGGGGSPEGGGGGRPPGGGQFPPGGPGGPGFPDGGPRPSPGPVPSPKPPPKNPQSAYQCRPNAVTPPRSKTPGPLPRVPGEPDGPSASPSPGASPHPHGGPHHSDPTHGPPTSMNAPRDAEFQFARYDGSHPQFGYAVYRVGTGAVYTNVDLFGPPSSGRPHTSTPPPGREGDNTLRTRLAGVERHSYHADATDLGAQNPVVADLARHRDPQDTTNSYHDPLTGRDYRFGELNAGNAASALTEANGKYLECANPTRGRAIFFDNGDHTFLPEAPGTRSAAAATVPASIKGTEKERRMLNGEIAGQSTIGHLFRDWVAATNGLRAEAADRTQNQTTFDAYLERSMKFSMYALAAIHTIPQPAKKAYEDLWVYNTARMMEAVRAAKARSIPYKTEAADTILKDFWDDTKSDWAMLRGQAQHILNRNSLQRLFNASGASHPIPDASPAPPSRRGPPAAPPRPLEM